MTGPMPEHLERVISELKKENERLKQQLSKAEAETVEKVRPLVEALKKSIDVAYSKPEIRQAVNEVLAHARTHFPKAFDV